MQLTRISKTLAELTANNDHSTSYVVAAKFLVDNACDQYFDEACEILVALERIKDEHDRCGSLAPWQYEQRNALYKRMVTLGRKMIPGDFDKYIYLNT